LCPRDQLRITLEPNSRATIVLRRSAYIDIHPSAEWSQAKYAALVARRRRRLGDLARRFGEGLQDLNEAQLRCVSVVAPGVHIR